MPQLPTGLKGADHRGKDSGIGFSDADLNEDLDIDWPMNVTQLKADLKRAGIWEPVVMWTCPAVLRSKRQICLWLEEVCLENVKFCKKNWRVLNFAPL